MGKQYSNEYEWAKAKIRAFLKQEGLGHIYKVKWIYPKPSESIRYSYLAIDQTDGTHSRRVAEEYTDHGVMLNFCQFYSGLAGAAEATALYERYNRFRFDGFVNYDI